MTDFVYPFRDFQTLLAMGYRNNILSAKRYKHNPLALKSSIEESKKSLYTDFTKQSFYRNMQLDKLLNAEVDTKPKEKESLRHYQINITDGNADWHPDSTGWLIRRDVRLVDYFSSGNLFDQYQNFITHKNRIGDLAYLNCISPIGLYITNNKELTVSYSGVAKNSLDCNVVFVNISKGKNVRLQENFTNNNIMLNKIYYIVREGATLELFRKHKGCNYNVIESEVIQHPNSNFVANIDADDSVYTQDIFDINSYNECTSHVYSRNNISKNTINNVCVNINHYGENSKSLIDVRTVLNDKSYSSFSGNIKIVKKAENVSAHMINKNLLLSNTATAVTEPNLDINTKEVECSHGCTISNIDKDVMYYLNSRGYSDTEAEEIIIESFLS